MSDSFPQSQSLGTPRNLPIYYPSIDTLECASSQGSRDFGFPSGPPHDQPQQSDTSGSLDTQAYKALEYPPTKSWSLDTDPYRSFLTPSLLPPPPLPPRYNTGYSAKFMSDTCSHGSSDSGYATKVSSIDTKLLQQSDPIKSFPSYNNGDQRSPDIEVIRAHTSSSQHKAKRRFGTSSPSFASTLPCLPPKETKYRMQGEETRRTLASAFLKKKNVPVQAISTGEEYTMRKEGAPPSGNPQASLLPIKAAAQLESLPLPPFYTYALDHESSGLKTSVPDPDVLMFGLRPHHTNFERRMEGTATTSEDVETDFSEAESFKFISNADSTYSSDDDSILERGDGGILDDCVIRIEAPSLETIPEREETLMAAESHHSTEEMLPVLKSRVLQTLSANEADQYHASLKVEWNVLSFMEHQFCDHDFPNTDLGAVITITGSAQHAQATTCSEYTRQNWPVHGLRILDALQDALNSSTHTSYSRIGACHDDEIMSNDVALSSYAELELLVTCEGFFLNIKSETSDVIVEVVQQIAWMGAALRTSADHQIQYCEPKVEEASKAKEGGLVNFRIVFELSSLSEGEQSCWFPLFENPVIAQGFPVPVREHGEQGLEVPLEIMAALGGAQHITEFDGGLVLKGYAAMFVPVKLYPQSIQWHLIRRDDEQRILYREINSECPNRAKLEEVDHLSLQNRRAFLGWWKSAETHLGTADAAYDDIDWSPTGEVRRSVEISGANIGFQSMITGQLSFKMGAKDGKLHLSQKGPFERIVQCAQNIPVALYDVVDRRAWLVHGLDVVLHIVRTRHSFSPYNLGGEPIELVPATPAKGTAAATEAIAANRWRQLYECDAATGKNYYFQDAILEIWSQMERLMEKEDSIEAQAGLALHGTMQSKLYGWEYMSLVRGKNFRRKEAAIAKSSGGWVDLVKDNDALVLFATGFDEIIRPVSDLSNLCHSWGTLPKGKDFLAAGVPILELLYSEAGSRLSRKHLSTSHLQWHRGSTLFEQCISKTSYRCECNRTQQIYHDSLFKTFGHVRPPGNLAENGCVVFGQTYHSFKSKKRMATEQNALYMLPNTSIQTDETTSQDVIKHGCLLTLSPPVSDSDFEGVNGHVGQSSRKPPSPVSSDDDLVQEEIAA